MQCLEKENFGQRSLSQQSRRTSVLLLFQNKLHVQGEAAFVVICKGDRSVDLRVAIALENRNGD